MWMNRLTFKAAGLAGRYWDLVAEFEGGDLPRGRSMIVAPNHTSFIDPWLVSWTLRLEMHYLINREWYERSRLWNFFFRANGTVPVSPWDPEATLTAVRSVLDRGESICIFPEGGVSADGNLKRFRPGIGWFAAVTGVPVVPVGVSGAFESLPKGSRWPKRGVVTVRAGRPMFFPNPGPDPGRRDTVGFVHDVRREVQRLAGSAVSVRPLAGEIESFHPSKRIVLSNIMV